MMKLMMIDSVYTLGFPTAFAPVTLWLLAALVLSVCLYVRKMRIIFRKRPKDAGACEVTPDEYPIIAGERFGNAFTGILGFLFILSLLWMIGIALFFVSNLPLCIWLLSPLPVQFLLTSLLRSLNQKLNEEERGLGPERPREKIANQKIILSALPALLAATIAFAVWYWWPDTRWYGSNPKAGVFTVSTAQELAGLSKIAYNAREDIFSGKTVRLTADINLARYGSWVPIDKFAGMFDGGGHVISNLTVKHDTYYGGLFGAIAGGRVENLGLKNVNIKGHRFVGGVAGHISNSTVANCYSIGSVSGERSVGGLVGVSYDNSVIRNSYSIGKVSGGKDDDSDVGGLVGVNGKSAINACYTVSTVTSDCKHTGPLVGKSYEGKVSNSFFDSRTSGVKGNGVGEGKTTEQMKQKETFTGWDFDGIWAIDGAVNNGYPHLSGKPDKSAIGKPEAKAMNNGHEQ